MLLIGNKRYSIWIQADAQLILAKLKVVYITIKKIITV